MIYLKIFTTQDLRTTGGGSNTLIAEKIKATGFFPAAIRTNDQTLKFNHASGSANLKYGYSSKTDIDNNEVRIKRFSKVMIAEGAAVGDIGVFRKQPNTADAYDVAFIKQKDPLFTYFKSLMEGNHQAIKVIADPAASHASTKINNPYNWLIYGAPGTGKSTFLEAETLAFGDRKVRVTFYPDYNYAKFVGSYKPATYYRNIGTGTYYTGRNHTSPAVGIVNEPVIDYRFVPGPFLSMLINAFKGLNRGELFLLMIEELNRAAAAAVFGEVFQLLDREQGTSVYRVQLSDEAMTWINDELSDLSFVDIRTDIMENGVYIPHNFYIWATMNSADQGVFPLDAAFKRRWQVKYLSLDANEDKISGITLTLAGVQYNWNSLRKSINSWLTIRAGVAEDRLIAPFFLRPEELADEESGPDAFKNKLLLYLKDDVLRHKKGFFNVDNQTISAINTHFAAHADPAKSWDFFSVLTQGEEGAADHIRMIYERVNAADAEPSDQK